MNSGIPGAAGMGARHAKLAFQSLGQDIKNGTVRDQLVEGTASLIYLARNPFSEIRESLLRRKYALADNQWSRNTYQRMAGYEIDRQQRMSRQYAMVEYSVLQQRQRNAGWDSVHFALDAFGMIPGVGEVADVVNAGLYSARGMKGQAAISATAAIPFIGWAATGTKNAYRGVRNISKAINTADTIADGLRMVKTGGNLSDIARFGNNLDFMVKAPKVGGRINPSDFARSLQGGTRYPGVDRFRDITLKKGKIVYGGAPGQSNFYTTPSAIRKAGGSRTSLFEGLQVKPHRKYGYRPGVTAYRVTEDTHAAFGRALSNSDYGPGGLPQLVVPDYEKVLQPVYSIPLGR